MRVRDNVLRFLNRLAPEGNLKNGLRSSLLGVYHAVPLELHINPGDCVVQVGTPSTGTVERLAASAGHDGRVIVIEAERGSATRLREFAQRRGLRNVTVIQKAVSNAPGQRTLLIASRGSDHRLEIAEIEIDNDYRDNAYVEKQIAEVDTLDNILRDLGVSQVDFVGVTVNGAELEVLQGMRETLEVTRRVFVKAHARRKDSGEAINEEVAALLRENEFHTRLTAGSRSVAAVWGRRAGDVYAWRENRTKVA